MSQIIRHCWMLLVAICFVGSVQAQISLSGEPASFDLDLGTGPEIVYLPAPNIDSVMQVEAELGDTPRAYTYGVVLRVEYSLENSGKWWMLEDGSRIWQLHLSSPGATTINIDYSNFHLPEGSKLFVYNPLDRSQRLGAFSVHNNKPHGQMATAMLRCDEVIIEYYEPAKVEFEGELQLSRVIHGFRQIDHLKASFGASAECNIDVNCPAGDPYEDQKRSVVLITYYTSAASGVLINNEREDKTPYILTAEHIIKPNDSCCETYTIYFGYESVGCDPTTDAYLGWSLVGAEVLSKRSRFDGTDFALFLFDDTIPVGYNAYFAGWDTDTTTPDSLVAIHHPQGDVKKISFPDYIVSTTNWSGSPGYTHWQSYLFPTEGRGAIQHGSSGSPMFNSAGYIIGQHTGTNPTNALPCIESQGVDALHTGKFSVSYDYWSDSTEQLKYWLDPDNTAITYLDGFDLMPANTCIGIRGDVNCDYSAYPGIDVSDVTFLVAYLFKSGSPPTCWEEANVNGDALELIQVDDLNYLVDYLFKGGPAPPDCP